MIVIDYMMEMYLTLPKNFEHRNSKIKDLIPKLYQANSRTFDYLRFTPKTFENLINYYIELNKSEKVGFNLLFRPCDAGIS